MQDNKIWQDVTVNGTTPSVDVAEFIRQMASTGSSIEGLSFVDVPSTGQREEVFQNYFNATILPQVKPESIAIEDTSKKVVLKGMSPSLSIYPIDYTQCAASMESFVQIKKGGDLTDAGCGQVVRYAKEILKAQPNRQQVIAALTDCYKVKFIRVNRDNGKQPNNIHCVNVEHTDYLPLSVDDDNANRFFRLLLTTVQYLPRVGIPNVTVDTLDCLGETLTSKIYGRLYEKSQVIKVSDIELIQTEVQILTEVNQLKVPNVIQLFEHSDTAMVLSRHAGTIVHGLLDKSITLSGQHFGSLIPTFFQLHSHDIYHRDPRPANIFYDRQGLSKSSIRLILADFGLSINPSSELYYQGAPMPYWSDRMLKAEIKGEMYTFTPNDDLHIYLKGIYSAFHSKDFCDTLKIVQAKSRQSGSSPAQIWLKYWQTRFAASPDWSTLNDAIKNLQPKDKEAYDTVEEKMKLLKLS